MSLASGAPAGTARGAGPPWLGRSGRIAIAIAIAMAVLGFGFDVPRFLAGTLGGYQGAQSLAPPAAPGRPSVAPSQAGRSVAPAPERPQVAAYAPQLRARASESLDAMAEAFPSLLPGYSEDWFRILDDDRPSLLAGGPDNARSRRQLWARFFAGAFDYTLMKPVQDGGARIVLWNPLADASLVAEVLADGRIWAWSIATGARLRAGETPNLTPLWLATSDGGTLAALRREHEDTLVRITDSALPLGAYPGTRPRAVEAVQDSILLRLQALAGGEALASAGAFAEALAPLVAILRRGDARELGQRCRSGCAEAVAALSRWPAELRAALEIATVVVRPSGSAAGATLLMRVPMRAGGRHAVALSLSPAGAGLAGGADGSAADSAAVGRPRQGPGAVAAAQAGSAPSGRPATLIAAEVGEIRAAGEP